MCVSICIYALYIVKCSCVTYKWKLHKEILYQDVSRKFCRNPVERRTSLICSFKNVVGGLLHWVMVGDGRYRLMLVDVFQYVIWRRCCDKHTEDMSRKTPGMSCTRARGKELSKSARSDLPRFSKEGPTSLFWVSYEFPMGFLWVSYEFPMGFLWVSSWVSYDFPMSFLWVSCEFPMSFLWVSYEWLVVTGSDW